MGVVKLAIGDVVVTFLWVVVAASLGPLGTIITSYFQVHPPNDLLVMTALIFLLVVIFDVVGQLLGGASFNPTANASFYAAGLGNDSLFSMAIRFPAQVETRSSLKFHLIICSSCLSFMETPCRYSCAPVDVVLFSIGNRSSGRRTGDGRVRA